MSEVTREQIAEALWVQDMGDHPSRRLKPDSPEAFTYLGRADAVLALIQNGADR